ncbi:hypothetical protein GEI7407_0666 [Geitlerinema sp. PCC 7407]|nr:hypothetical protein GEI7407_0666 [Geitlerinema sp. PCC 7407]
MGVTKFINGQNLEQAGITHDVTWLKRAEANQGAHPFSQNVLSFMYLPYYEDSSRLSAILVQQSRCPAASGRKVRRTSMSY